jgi:hypothetical protein
MRSIISKAMMLVAFSAMLLSFSPKPGGEGFEIMLNNKVMLQQFGKDMNTMQNLQLTRLSANDQLTVKYYHCGTAGKKRVITIRDGQNNLLKEFRYADAASSSTGMAVPVKDILGFKKGSSVTLKLYYSSGELPNGRLLTSLLF